MLLPDADCTDFARKGGIGSQSVGATTFGERNCGTFSDDVPEKNTTCERSFIYYIKPKILQNNFIKYVKHTSCNYLSHIT